MLGVCFTCCRDHRFHGSWLCAGHDPKICRQDGGAEDVKFGKCMERLGVKTANTTDALGRSRFHCFDPETHLFGGYPKWYYRYDASGAHKVSVVYFLQPAKFMSNFFKLIFCFLSIKFLF